MTAYIVRRVVHSFIILILVTLVVFVTMRWLPGDPILIYMGEGEMTSLTPEMLEKQREELGLNRPMIVQYLDWLNNILHGDMGVSIDNEEKVSTLIAERLPVTAHLGAIAFVMSAILGVLLGLVAALRRGKWVDTVTTLVANIGVTIPVFWLGILMIYIFGLKLRWLPIYGYTSPFEDFWMSTRQVIMPVIYLAIFHIAAIARQMRSSMLDVIGQDYIRTASSKGLTEKVIVNRHALKNSLIPVITVLGLHVRMIFGGQVLVETVFSIPGIGKLMVNSIFGHDYVVVQAGVFIITVVVLVANLIVDISYGWFDPRIRYD